MTERFGDSTRAVKATASEAIPGEPVMPALVSASAFHLSPEEGSESYVYGRYGNPTCHQLEMALARLEGATAALAFGSGMAAITAALRVVAAPGSTLVVPADGYYQTRRFAVESLEPVGVTVIQAAADQMYSAAAEADVVLVESPTNPGLDVVDIHRLASICRSRGARLLVDNTTATPFGQQPLSLGADLVVASATKVVSGHSDLLAGYVAGSQPELMAALERERLLAGPILGAFEAWLALRGLSTAGLRHERQCQNALGLATALRGHPAVLDVRYPGLPDDPSYPVVSTQMRRSGGLLSIELADAEAVHALVRNSELLVAATSFGGIHTSVDRRARWGDAVAPGFARIAAGIEDTADLVADVQQALDAR